MITFEQKWIGEIQIQNETGTTVATLLLELGSGYVLTHVKKGYFLDPDALDKISKYAKNKTLALNTAPLKNSC
ncbi:MAG: hypothetical protein OEY89_13465 [Gammaproteobacteria bacterium]|nr:hypothetical protein [Gammaproteobacteria bacterium]